MIIACPECTSPFQVVDGQIAPLLQIECPTCTFRMILDFEAANDVSLREEGMKLAQGFRDEASYRQAVGAGEVHYAASEARAPKPELRAVPEPAIEVELEPRRPVSTPAPTPTPVQPQATPQAVQPQAEPARGKPPVRARPTLIAQTAPPPVRQPTELVPPQQRTVEPQAEAAVDTHVGPPPGPEPGMPAVPVEVSPPAPTPFGSTDDDFSVDLDEPEVEPEVVPAPRPRPAIEAEPQIRTPPHSPSPSPNATKPGQDEPDVPAVEPKPPEKVEQTGKKKGGALRTAMLMFLLLILMGAAGLMGWSVIETQDPNPLPMLKNKFGIDLGFGVPAETAPDAAGAGAEGADAPAGEPAAAQ